ncbi:MAG: hypothetical protein AB8F94_25465 [Saprospiraceae bacterium]
MKKEILDIPFRDSIFDFLEIKEEIIWQGEPQLFPNRNRNEKLYLGYSLDDILSRLMFTLLCVFIVLALILLEDYPIAGLIFVIGTAATVIIYEYIYKGTSRNIEYILTQKKVFFKFTKKGSTKTAFHAISYGDISKVDVAMEGDLEDIGAIFFYLKNPNNKPFTTRNIRYGGERYQITMELIEHPYEVIKLIREGIENSKEEL